MSSELGVLIKPGLHSHNFRRFTAAKPPSGRGMQAVSVILALLGVAALGYYAYTLADQKVYQDFANWSFEQQIAGRSNTTFSDYIRTRTPFGFLAGRKAVDVAIPNVKPGPSLDLAKPADGAVLGRVEIGRLNVSAIVRQGVGEETLRDSVGHVPSTAEGGQTGNFAIAAHRDTLFRALKDIQKDDLISFQSTAGTFTYKVAATKIVKPTDVSVLQADGGGLIEKTDTGKPEKLLTMITCYPFYYVGSAPKRFIVEAKLVN